jgi:allophanate hydrolase subunit 2
MECTLGGLSIVLSQSRWISVTGAPAPVLVGLDGTPLRIGSVDLPSEGMALGSIQVPPSGQPIVFLADHPITGGYPVIGVVTEDDLDLIGQAPPGTTLRLVPHS